MYLVLLETHGNQGFIFESPRLREIIGASNMLRRLNTWTKESWDALSPGAGYEERCVLSTSGKVVVAVDSEFHARSLIAAVTRRALVEAPTMDVSGVFLRVSGEYVHAEDLKLVHAEAAHYADSRTGQRGRFASMPFLRSAKDSSLAASPDQDDRPRPTGVHSLAAQKKRSIAQDSTTSYLEEISIRAGLSSFSLPNSVARLEKLFEEDGKPGKELLPKVAVIHIDINGLGSILQRIAGLLDEVPPDDFKRAIGCRPTVPEAFGRLYHHVSRQIDDILERAITQAWSYCGQLWVARMKAEDGEVPLPIVPVLVGGDDITVITSGDLALPFATKFLTALKEISNKEFLGNYTDSGKGTELNFVRLAAGENGAPAPLTASAGVAIVRRNFPFHIAYGLADELCARAKKVAKQHDNPCSAVNFHMLFDTTVLDAVELVDATERLTKRPYRIGGKLSSSSNSADHPNWDRMVERAAVFMGLEAAPGAQEAQQFPKTRAVRIRKYLAEGNIRDAQGHWGAAGRELDDGDKICQALGGFEYLVDLLELSELLPAGVMQPACQSCDVESDNQMEGQ